MMETWLPHKLRTLRVRQGLTLIEAAKRTGVTRATLSELERGHRHPVAPTLVKIAEGYGVSIDELLEEPVPFDAAPTEEAGFDLEWIIEMDMTEFGQYAATLEDDALRRLVEQIDAEAPQRCSTDIEAIKRLPIRRFIANLDLQVREKRATPEQRDAALSLAS